MGQLSLKYARKYSEIVVKNSKQNFPPLYITLGYSMAITSPLDDAFSGILKLEASPVVGQQPRYKDKNRRKRKGGNKN